MRLRSMIVVVCVIAGTMTSGFAYDSPQCFWGRPNDPNVVNVLHPDEAANYWAARPVVPPGAATRLLT